MSIDIGESLMQSWLKHVKCCDIVQTNWKASMHVVYDKQTADDFLLKLRKVPEFNFFAPGQTAENIIRQAEIDALGCVVSKGHYIAGEIAFHEDGLHYHKPDSVPSKILRTILCIYGYLRAKQATIIFATPYIKNAAEKKALEDFVCIVNTFLQSACGKYHVKLFADTEFEIGILNPVLYLVDEIKDNSEIFVRACKLINTAKACAPAVPGGNYIETKCGKIDISEMETQELIENFVIPKLSNMPMKRIKVLFNKEDSQKSFKVSYPFLSYARDKCAGKYRYYARSYYLRKTNKEVFVTSECADRTALINWINSTK